MSGPARSSGRLFTFWISGGALLFLWALACSYLQPLSGVSAMGDCVHGSCAELGQSLISRKNEMGYVFVRMRWIRLNGDCYQDVIKRELASDCAGSGTWNVTACSNSFSNISSRIKCPFVLTLTANIAKIWRWPRFFACFLLQMLQNGS